MGRRHILHAGAAQEPQPAIQEAPAQPLHVAKLGSWPLTDEWNRARSCQAQDTPLQPTGVDRDNQGAVEPPHQGLLQEERRGARLRTPPQVHPLVLGERGRCHRPRQGQGGYRTRGWPARKRKPHLIH